jgi:dihydrofolate synthase/folylpolyglutamate synthase
LALTRGKEWWVEAWDELPEEQSQTVALRHLGEKHLLALPLLGEHQHENLACALAALKLLGPRFELGWKSVMLGLAKAEWPGRLQALGTRPLSLVDGAHNPDGARVLGDYLRGLKERRKFRRTAFVVGVLKDKDWRRMFREWEPLADKFFLATPPDARALAKEEAAAWFQGRAQADRVRICPDLPEAWEAARRWAGSGGLVVAAGSLYSAGALLKKYSKH